MRLQSWLHGLKQATARLAVVEIGAGTAVPTVRRLSESVAQDADATLVRINPREAEVHRDGLGLPFNAADGIRRICERVALHS